jgi:hypothetical protein
MCPKTGFGPINALRDLPRRFSLAAAAGVWLNIPFSKKGDLRYGHE